MPHSKELWAEIDDWCEANGIEDSFDHAAGNCGMMPDGQCGHAGSEYCEFECPFMAEQYEKLAKKRSGRAQL